MDIVGERELRTGYGAAVTQEDSDWRAAFSPNRVLVTLIRRWRVILVVPMLVVGITVARVLMLPPEFVATARFVPEAAAGTGDRTSLAVMAGLAVGLTSVGESPEFYADVLRRRPVLQKVVTADYSAAVPGSPSGSEALLTELKANGETAEIRLANAMAELVNRTNIAVDRQTGIVAVGVTFSKSALSAAVANEYVKQLFEFNRTSRQTRARSRRQFIEARAAEAQQALNEAERRRTEFQQRNLAAQSPALLAQSERLNREAMLRQEQYVIMNNQLQAARIAEVDDVPRLTVVEPAVAPLARAGPKRKQIVVMTALASFVAVVLLTLLAEFGGPPLTRQLRRAWLEARSA